MKENVGIGKFCFEFGLEPTCVKVQQKLAESVFGFPGLCDMYWVRWTWNQLSFCAGRVLVLDIKFIFCMPSIYLHNSQL